MNKLVSTENRVFISLVGPFETGKLSQLIYNWPQNGTFQPKVDKNYFFYQGALAKLLGELHFRFCVNIISPSCKTRRC